MRAAEAWQGMSWFSPCLLTAAFGSAATAAIRHARKGNLPDYPEFRLKSGSVNGIEQPLEGEFTSK